MKKTVITMLLLLPALAFGQQEVAKDTAAEVVDRYLRLLNVESYSEDSMLVMETAVTVYGSEDTLWMKRWFSPARKYRVEVWHKDSLIEGLISNDLDNFLQYDASHQKWVKISEKSIVTNLSGYDFRGPLYLWRWNGSTLTWNGLGELKGKPMQVVKVVRSGMYDRYYMFDPDSGLLTLIMESEDFNPANPPRKETHIEWKSINEYLPVSNHLVPSLESFMRDGKLTILSTTAHLEKIIPRIFNRE